MSYVMEVNSEEIVSVNESVLKNTLPEEIVSIYHAFNKVLEHVLRMEIVVSYRISQFQLQERQELRKLMNGQQRPLLAGLHMKMLTSVLRVWLQLQVSTIKA